MDVIRIDENGVSECYTVQTVECDRFRELSEHGFKIFVPMPRPVAVELGEFEELISDIVEQQTKYVERWIVRTDKSAIAIEINRLKAELATTDYQVIKSYEYTLVGEQPPYDISELHRERQEIREKIKEFGMKM